MDRVDLCVKLSHIIKVGWTTWTTDHPYYWASFALIGDRR